jgi:hypothetical protein
LGEWAAGIAGGVLLGSLFLPWYGYGFSSGPTRTFDAWQAFGAIDVLLAVVALMAIALAVITAIHPTAAVPIALASLLGLVGLVATGLVVYRVISPPDIEVLVLASVKRPTGYIPVHETREVGLWMGLAACVGATVAGLYAMRDEGFPHAVRAARRVEVETLPAPPAEGAQGRRS